MGSDERSSGGFYAKEQITKKTYNERTYEK